MATIAALHRTIVHKAQPIGYKVQEKKWKTDLRERAEPTVTFAQMSLENDELSGSDDAVCLKSI